MWVMVESVHSLAVGVCLFGILLSIAATLIHLLLKNATIVLQQQELIALQRAAHIASMLSQLPGHGQASWSARAASALVRYAWDSKLHAVTPEMLQYSHMHFCKWSGVNVTLSSRAPAWVVPERIWHCTTASRVKQILVSAMKAFLLAHTQ